MRFLIGILVRAVTVIVLLAAIAVVWNDNARAATPWDASYFPNVPLVTQDGKQVRFFDDLIKGKVVAINFIFTGCSASCSMETARLRGVQDQLADRMGKDVFFYSISIDPDNDTPEALKAYADRFRIGPGWTFLTGRNEDIILLRQKLGLYQVAANQKTQNGQTDHDLGLLIGNQSTGRWMKASPFEDPQILATQLGSWLHNWKVQGALKNDTYANAPTHMRQRSRGEELYETRCASCHSIGAPAGSLADLRAIGPDLAGVTQLRSRAWLARWLKEPDVMLAEKDRLATSLYLKYNKVAMPNLRLKDSEIDQLLTFLETGYPTETARNIARQ